MVKPSKRSGRSETEFGSEVINPVRRQESQADVADVRNVDSSLIFKQMERKKMEDSMGCLKDESTMLGKILAFSVHPATTQRLTWDFWVLVLVIWSSIWEPVS